MNRRDMQLNRDCPYFSTGAAMPGRRARLKQGQSLFNCARDGR